VPNIVRVAIGFVFGLGLATVMFLLFGGTLQRGSQAARSEGLPVGSPKDFSDGLGIYFLNDGKYNFLYWKKKLFAPGTVPSEQDIAEAAKSAIPVKKDVRFYSYGLDISRWALVPPYLMAFCVIRDMRAIEGIHPIRIKLIDKEDLIYELLLPPVISELSAGNTLWTINYQYSCNDGWVFRFQ
jgi:hypothetical protein